MANKPENPQAFPLSRENEHWFNPGMTLRDWFAGQALAGLLSGNRATATTMAIQAYVAADAMLSVREATPLSGES